MAKGSGALGRDPTRLLRSLAALLLEQQQHHLQLTKQQQQRWFLSACHSRASCTVAGSLDPPHHWPEVQPTANTPLPAPQAVARRQGSGGEPIRVATDEEAWLSRRRVGLPSGVAERDEQGHIQRSVIPHVLRSEVHPNGVVRTCPPVWAIYQSRQSCSPGAGDEPGSCTGVADSVTQTSCVATGRHQHLPTDPRHTQLHSHMGAWTFRGQSCRMPQQHAPAWPWERRTLDTTAVCSGFGSTHSTHSTPSSHGHLQSPSPTSHSRQLTSAAAAGGGGGGGGTHEASDGGEKPGGWWSTMKGVLWGRQQQEAEGADEVAVQRATLDAFADQLAKARKFGGLTSFGRGLPRGGETQVVASLKRQEDIARALSAALAKQGGSSSSSRGSSTSSGGGGRGGGVGPAVSVSGASEAIAPSTASMLSARVRREAADAVGCAIGEVDAMVDKYEWYCEAARKVEQLKAEGKPLPKTFAEVEEMMGGRSWAKKMRVGGGGDRPVSRNAMCPCGSGKRYKRCCGSGS